MPLDGPRRRTGVLLVNLGTPDAPRPREVRRYLRQFLRDPRVLDMNPVARWLLLELVILPFRPRRSAAAYASIWTPKGSPLLTHSQNLRDGVARALGPDCQVELAMRYGSPAIAERLAALAEHVLEKIVVLPLFPQYSTAATESALAEVERAARSLDLPPLAKVPPFYDDAGFIAAFAEAVRPALAGFGADHVLFSYHGLPVHQLVQSPPGGHCLASPDCCAEVGTSNALCYRAQCFATTRSLAAALELSRAKTSVSFQSRLGPARWIEPYTDRVLPELADARVKRLAVLCPSFVADCLETLEEIGIRAREQWRGLGGDELELLSCPNALPRWVTAVADLVSQ